ncbi:amidase [Acidisoma cellulosilytica]|uniref:Amidase n=1 Tax=Acidisoma cellulosilyticum TaxID=2802395 RepID=A0A963Z1Y9_9PROT|nr:amidase [Acidisoma cellulosilyticum]MCB8881353.1 amidase [Acidisoma cellulosilyticum]
MSADHLSNARDLGRSVQSGRHKAVEVAQVALDAIAAQNARLNAFVSVDADGVLAAAAAVDAQVKDGIVLPLAGVPVAVKDNIWVKGQRVTQGSRLFADFVAPDDAVAVSRLRAAGAVIIGMTNTSEFACKGNTTNLLFGPTRHPLDPRLTPGGSSGGSAAAVAAGLVPIALGTDAGGSSCRPPAHVGAVGFKPSLGAIPYGPGFREPLQSISCLCPMTNGVADAALAFSVLAGLPREGGRPPGPPLRIAYSPRFGLSVPVDPEIEAMVEAAVEGVRRQGFAVQRADPPWPDGMSEASLMPLQHAGLAAIYGETFRQSPDLFDPDIASQIDRGLSLSGAKVAMALIQSAEVTQSLARFLRAFDILVGPTVPCFSWPLDRLGPETIAGQPVEPRAHAAFTPLFNHARVPAISIPCGKGSSGLPAGLQLIAAEGRDLALLDFAAVVESILSEMPTSSC